MLKKNAFIIITMLFLFSGCVSNNQSIAKKIDGTVISNEKKADNYLKIGIHSVENGNLPKAFRSLFKALSYNDRDPRIYDTIAYSYIQRGDYEKANKFYLKAFKYDAGSSVYNNYATFLISQGKYKKSISYAIKAAEDPTYNNSYISYINLGDAYYKLNMQKESLQAYAKAIKVDKKAENIVNNRIKDFK